MFISGIVSLLFNLTDLGSTLFGASDGTAGMLPGWSKYPMVVGITTVVWIVVTFITPPESAETLRKFYRKTRPGGPGWRKVVDEAREDNDSLDEPGAPWTVPSGVLAMILGCVLVYSCMFATGNWIYGNYALAASLTGVTLVSAFLLKKVWDKIKGDVF
jgi:hypothetical protein